VWSRSFGDSSEQFGRSIAVSDDRVVVFGDFFGAIDFGVGAHLGDPEDLDIYLATLAAADGAAQWSKAYGDAGAWQWGDDVAVDASGNISLTGSFGDTLSFGGPLLNSSGEDDVYLAGLDQSGGHQWSNRYGDDTTQIGWAVDISASGKLAAAGSYNDIINFGGGPLSNEGDLDVYVAVFNAQHQLMWQKGFGSSHSTEDSSDEGLAVAFDSQENVIVAGYFKNDMVIDGLFLEHDGEHDAFVAKFNPSGTLMWAKRFGYGGGQDAFGLAVSNAPGLVDFIYVVGGFEGAINFGGPDLVSTNGSYDAFLAVLTPDGNFHAQLGAGDFDEDMIEAVAIDAQGNAVLMGFFRGTMTLGNAQLMGNPESRDLFIVKLDPSLNPLWSRVWGDAQGWQGEWLGQDVALDAQGYVYVTATFDGAVDTGVNVHQSQGNWDLLVAKLKP
jgi:hypothetical protein